VDAKHRDDSGRSRKPQLQFHVSVGEWHTDHLGYLYMEPYLHYDDNHSGHYVHD
jgi:hypothetical protein